MHSIHVHKHINKKMQNVSLNKPRTENMDFHFPAGSWTTLTFWSNIVDNYRLDGDFLVKFIITKR